MPEYIITPESSQLPPAPSLLENLHRRGFPVEITLKGPSDLWESVRFLENGPPLVECDLTRDPASGRLTVAISADAPLEALDLQAHLVGLLLDEMGGQADNTYTRERFNREEFSRKLKHHHGSHRNLKEILWLVFSWAVVLGAVLLYFTVPAHLKPVDLVVIGISFLSAAGFTYTHFKA